MAKLVNADRRIWVNKIRHEGFKPFRNVPLAGSTPAADTKNEECERGK